MATDGTYRLAVPGAAGHAGPPVVAEARRRIVPLRLSSAQRRASRRCPSGWAASSTVRRRDVRTGTYAVLVRLRTLSEAECYARCYGGSEDAVRVVRLRGEQPPPLVLTGEEIRRLFEDRLDHREPELDAA